MRDRVTGDSFTRDLAEQLRGQAALLRERARALDDAALILDPPPPPQRRRDPGVTSEMVRDAGIELNEFNLTEMADYLDRPRSRAAIGGLVALLVERGVFVRTGPSRGPMVRWHYADPRAALGQLRAVRTGSGPRLGGAVPLTGRAQGSSGRPGRDKKVAAKGHRIKRARLGT